MQSVYAMLSFVVCPALHCFSTLSHKGHHFRKKLLSIKYVFRVSLQSLSEIFFILRNERHMIEYVNWSSRKIHCMLVRFNMELEFS